MGKDNLKEIADNYVAKFDYFNDGDRREYYKWEVAYSFKDLMDQALNGDPELFSSNLTKVKKSTSNLFDNYIQPFAGLCKFAEKEPDTVRQMFLDLYANDDNDISKRQEKIDTFLIRSNTLCEKRSSGSFLYKNDYHSVTGYLFFYDPDSQFLFKETHARKFADVIGFVEDWGNSKNFNLSVYYKMCNQVLNRLDEVPELLSIDRSRFTRDLPGQKGPLHPDTNKHILLFDLIYCTSVYELYEGLTYKKRSGMEKKELLHKQKRAISLYNELKKTTEEYHQLNGTLLQLKEMLPEGSHVNHKNYGEVLVIGYKKDNIVLQTSDGEKSFSLATSIASGTITIDNPNFMEIRNSNTSFLKEAAEIRYKKEDLEQKIQPYMIYLD